MDNITHTLFGVTLARTPLGRAGRGTTAALILASNAPDVDIVATAGGATNYLAWHRGPTHGPLGVLGLGLLSALIVAAARRFNPKWRHDDDASFGMLIAVSMIGVVCHILMDLPTSYGTRLLSPFSWRWFAVDWMPIIDVYLLVALATGLFFGRTSADARRRNATIVLAFMAMNYGLRGVTHHQALTTVPRLFGPTLPPPCDATPRQAGIVDRWPQAPPSPPPAGKRCVVEVAAMPSFLSPFSWRIVAQMSNAYEIREVDLLDARLRAPANEAEVFWRLSLRYPNVWTPQVERAAATRLGRVFLGFSRFPAARAAVDAHGAVTVRFTDMRFVGGPIVVEQPARRVQPFTATVKLDADGRVISESLLR